LVIGSVDKADFLSFMGDYLAGTGIVTKEANYNSRPTLNAFDQYSGGDETPTGMPNIHTLALSMLTVRGLGIQPKKLRGIVPRRTYVLQVHAARA